MLLRKTSMHVKVKMRIRAYRLLPHLIQNHHRMHHLYPMTEMVKVSSFFKYTLTCNMSVIICPTAHISSPQRAPWPSIGGGGQPPSDGSMYEGEGGKLARERRKKKAEVAARRRLLAGLVFLYASYIFVFFSLQLICERCMVCCMHWRYEMRHMSENKWEHRAPFEPGRSQKQRVQCLTGE